MPSDKTPKGFGAIGALLMERAEPLLPAPAAFPVSPLPIAQAGAPDPTVLVPVGWLEAQQRGLTTEPPALVGKGIMGRRAMGHLAGEDKAGKTQRVLQLAVEGTHGLPIFGTFPVSAPFRTLLLEAELEWPTLNERHEDIVTALALNRQRVNDNFHILPLPQLNVLAPDGQNQIACWVKGFDLLILDPISSFYVGPDENDNAGMQAVANALRKLTRTLDISILTTGHLRKPAAGVKRLDLATAFDAVRGATSYRAAMDTVIVIQTGNHVAWDFFVRTRRPTDGAASTEEYTLGSLSPHWVLASGQHLYAQRTDAKARDTKMLAWIKQGHSAGTLPKGKEAVYQKAIDEGAASSRPTARRALESLEGRGEIGWQDNQIILTGGSGWGTPSPPLSI